MRRSIFYLASVAVLAIGCQAELGQDTPAGQFKTMFTAVTESSADVKTSMNQDEANDKIYNIHWTSGDKVLVSDGLVAAEFTAEPTDNPTVAALSTSATDVPAEGAEKYYAAFPALDGTSAGPGGYTVVIPSAQTWVKGEFDMPMVGVGGSDMKIAFMNAASILKITPNNLCDSYDKVRVKTIEVCSETANIAGNVAVSYDGESVPVVGEVTNGSNTITLDCGEEGAEFSETFFIAMVPGSYESLTIKITSNGGGSQTFTLNTPAGKSYERSKYASVGVTIGNLAIYETANCYLVKKAGTYKFPVNIKGNGNNIITENVHGSDSKVASSSKVTVMESSIDVSTIASISTTVISQQDRNPGAFVMDNTIKNVSYADGYVTFTVPTDFVPGNVRVGVHSSESTDEYLWSWHIWVNDQVEDVYCGNPHANVGDVELMNMNLGSLQTSDNLATYAEGNSGLYYQWGRKDPFPPFNGTDQTMPEGYEVNQYCDDVSNKEASEQTAATYPYVFYSGNAKEWCVNSPRNHWGASPTATNPTTVTDYELVKTMFDPCPPGYHVMSAFVVKYIAYDESAEATYDKRVKMEYDTHYMQTKRGDKPVFPFDGGRTNSNTAPSNLIGRSTKPMYWTASYYNAASYRGNLMKYHNNKVKLEGVEYDIVRNAYEGEAYACSVRAQKQ